MQAKSILMVTQDSVLWSNWQGLEEHGWAVERGMDLRDMGRWRDRGGVLVMLDAALPNLPSWSDGVWADDLSQLKVLVLNVHMSDEQGQSALARGAYGYAHAYLSALTLDRIVSSIEAGSIWMGRSLLQRLLQDIDNRLIARADRLWAKSLSVREAEVAELAAIGQSNADIASALEITERTVRAHLSSVFEKLQVNDRLKLALKVHGVGL